MKYVGQVQGPSYNTIYYVDQILYDTRLYICNTSYDINLKLFSMSTFKTSACTYAEPIKIERKNTYTCIYVVSRLMTIHTEKLRLKVLTVHNKANGE